LFHNFWIKGTRDIIFAKTAQTLNQTKEKERLTGGTRESTDPTVRDPIAEARLDRRRSRRRRGLGHGEEHHRAPHSIPHRMVPETLTLPDPRYLALMHGGTAVVRG